MDASSSDSYKPPPEFEEDTKPPLVKPEMPDTTELCLLQCPPVNQGIQCTQPYAQMSTEFNDVDAKLWPSNIEKLFIQLMVEEMVKGNMQEGIFHKRIWEKILVQLNKQTKRNFKIAQVKTKFNRLRQRHRIFSQLLQYSGLGWDSETNTISASDEVWKNVLTAMPKAKEFRRKGCENYIQLRTLFDKTITTGVMAFAPTHNPTNIDEEHELNERFISTRVHVDVDAEDDVHPVQGDLKETPLAKRAKSGSSAKSKKIGGKGKRISEMTEAINNLAHINEKRIESKDARYAAKYAAMAANSSTSSAMKPIAPTNDYSLEKAIDLLNSYNNIPSERFMKILQALYKRRHRVAFLTLNEERREMWMEWIGKQ